MGVEEGAVLGEADKIEIGISLGLYFRLPVVFMIRMAGNLNAIIGVHLWLLAFIY